MRAPLSFLTAAVLALGFTLTAPAEKSVAAGAEVAPPAVDWSFNGPLGTYDRVQLQRGFQVYKQVCSGCHSMNLVAYRHLGMLGFSEAEVRAIASGYTVTDGPNDEGEMYARPAEPKDRIVQPFPNEQAARYANAGALPPDMSLLAKARPHGPDYIHAVLTGYEEVPPEMEGHMAEGMHYNEYFPGHQIAMAAPLQDGLVTYKGLDGEADFQPDVDEMARDVSAFLMWAAEPHMEKRKQTGLKVILFLLVFTGIMFAVKRRIWADAH